MDAPRTVCVECGARNQPGSRDAYGRWHCPRCVPGHGANLSLREMAELAREREDARDRPGDSPLD